ncbi:VWA domain-containing protein [Granulicella sp. 5B5]|uniref:VWA domain-containing protein n=1 Tax=Granulicella sp. 5B5 TaxID=1617967 RepID=UPI0015F3E4E7|nr:VWA domain-containing protein [Granulicella sp. 5B5]QMV19278.1 VWA domain-containing protein [Granulicella sp. 5B5]
MFATKYAGVATLAVGLFFLPIKSVKAQAAAAPIQLDVTVTGAGKRPAPELSEKDFTLLDNKTPRAVSSFAVMEGKAAPTEVVIVIDSVNTPYTALSYQREQIAQYLRNKGAALPYPTTFAILTDTNFQLYNTTTTNGAVLSDALNAANIGLRDINRSQGFYGASDRMSISINGLRQLIELEEKRPGRKLVLWVSPGWPILSGPGVELDDKEQRGIYANVVSFSTELRKAGITLYNINSWGVGESLGRAFYYESFVNGLKKPGDATLGNLSLQVLAEQSGGLVLNSSDVVGMLQQCAADADHYYRITFMPEPGEGAATYHQLQVKVAAGGLTARTREGYYTQP